MAAARCLGLSAHVRKASLRLARCACTLNTLVKWSVKVLRTPSNDVAPAIDMISPESSAGGRMRSYSDSAWCVLIHHCVCLFRSARARAAPILSCAKQFSEFK